MPGGDDGRRFDFTHSRHRYWAGGSAKLIACRVAITDSPASVDVVVFEVRLASTELTEPMGPTGRPTCRSRSRASDAGCAAGGPGQWLARGQAAARRVGVPDAVVEPIRLTGQRAIAVS